MNETGAAGSRNIPIKFIIDDSQAKKAIASLRAQIQSLGKLRVDIGGTVAKNADELRRQAQVATAAVEKQATATSKVESNLKRTEALYASIARHANVGAQAIQQLGWPEAKLRQLGRAFENLAAAQRTFGPQVLQRSEVQRYLAGQERRITGTAAAVGALVSDKDVRLINAFNQAMGVTIAQHGRLRMFMEDVVGYARFQIRWFAGATLIFGSAAAIAGAVRGWMRFAQTLKDIQAISGATEEQIRGIAKAALETSMVTPLAADEVAALGLQLIRAGLDADQLSRTMLNVGKVATVSGEDIRIVADAFTTAIFAWRLSADETAEIGNIIAGTLNYSRLAVEDLGTAYNYLAGVASSMNRSFAETNAVMAVLSNMGLRASTIGTGLSQVFQNLLDPTDEFRGALRRLGIELEEIDPRMNKVSEIVRKFEEANFDAARAMSLMEVRAGRTFMFLMRAGADALEDMEKRLIVQGQLQRALETSMEGPIKQLERMRNVMLNVGISAIGKLEWAIKGAVSSLEFLGRAGYYAVSFLDTMPGKFLTVVAAIAVMRRAVVALARGLGAISGLRAGGPLGILGMFAGAAGAGYVAERYFGDDSLRQIDDMGRAVDGLGRKYEQTARAVQAYADVVDRASERALERLKDIGRVRVDVPDVFIELPEHLREIDLSARNAAAAIREVNAEIGIQTDKPSKLRQDWKAFVELWKKTPAKEELFMGGPVLEQWRKFKASLADIWRRRPGAPGAEAGPELPMPQITEEEKERIRRDYEEFFKFIDAENEKLIKSLGDDIAQTPSDVVRGLESQKEEIYRVLSMALSEVGKKSLAVAVEEGWTGEALLEQIRASVLDAFARLAPDTVEKLREVQDSLDQVNEDIAERAKEVSDAELDYLEQQYELLETLNEENAKWLETIRETEKQVAVFAAIPGIVRELRSEEALRFVDPETQLEAFNKEVELMQELLESTRLTATEREAIWQRYTEARVQQIRWEAQEWIDLGVDVDLVHQVMEKRIEEATDRMAQFWENLADDIRSSLEAGLFDLFKGGISNMADAFSQFADFLHQTFARALAKMISEWLIFGTMVEQPMGGWGGLLNILKGLFGAGGAAAGAAGYDIREVYGPVLPYAHGGIVTKPTLALLGEAGPEVVTNLSRSGQGGLNVVINIENQTGLPVDAKTGPMRFDGESYVVGVVLKNIRQGGALREVMKGSMT